MNEAEIKKYVKESLVKPSDSFTGNVMKKIEAAGNTKRKFSWLFVLGCICGIILAILLIFTVQYFPARLYFMDYSVKINPMFVQVTGILFILFEFNRLLETRRIRQAEHI